MRRDRGRVDRGVFPGRNALRAKLFDRCAPKDGIEPFDQLVEQFMSTEPYSNAQRVFVIDGNASAHRGQGSIQLQLAA